MTDTVQKPEQATVTIGDGVQATVPEPCILVIFGATGDLAQRKLLPALYALAGEGSLPTGFTILGTGRNESDDQTFRATMKKAVHSYSRIGFHEATWADFEQGLCYEQVDPDLPTAMDTLRERLEQIDQKRGTKGNYLFYLAVPPSGFGPLSEMLGKAGLAQAPGKIRRLIVEKPLGHNLASARALNERLHEAFDEDQIFRIDHYLGKETVQNLMVFRFANGIFEPIWNRQYIDHVQITVAESIGIEGRSAYYEESGALRDIVQNHIMQLVAIIGMEAPSNFASETVRDEKVKLLRAVRPIHPDDVLNHTVRGQYAEGTVNGEYVPGYRSESGVNPLSLRETFVAMKLDIDNWRWADTPFYLRAGKRMPKRATEVAIQFRRVPHSPFSGHSLTPSGVLPPNAIDPDVLTIHIQPDEGITLSINAKVPGRSTTIRTVNMDFAYGSAFSTQSPDAYERLLLDCMLGDATLFAREDEVEEAWRFCTAILDGWRAHPPDKVMTPNYAAGSWGPDEAFQFIERDGRQWHRM